MGCFVVDNSVVMSWCFEDERSTYSEGVLGALQNREARVPSVWPLEVVNVLLAAERRNRLTRRDSARFLDLIRALPIRVETEPPERVTGEILPLARDTGLSSYDASSLDLALRSGAPLATLDKRLRKAARACAVPVFSP